MYLRHSKRTKNGKTHTYWRIVKSERVGGKVRQVTVAQLGELDAEAPREGRRPRSWPNTSWDREPSSRSSSRTGGESAR
jgi:hypothetical protein